MLSPEYYEAIKDNILLHGRHCQAVMPCEGDGSLPFVYTIGNHDRGLPELLLIGSCEGAIGHVLNDLSEQMIAMGSAFKDGDTPSFGGDPSNMAVRVIRARPEVKDEYTIQTGQHYGHEDYAVMQVIVPDPNGKFPGDEGASTGWADVPVYGLN